MNDLYDVMSVDVILSACMQDYCKRNQLILLTLGVMIGPTNRKNQLTFADDLVPDTDSGSLFHFPHHYGIWILRDLLTFLT